MVNIFVAVNTVEHNLTQVNNSTQVKVTLSNHDTQYVDTQLVGYMLIRNSSWLHEHSCNFDFEQSNTKRR